MTALGFSDRAGIGPETPEERKRPVVLAARVIETRVKAVLVAEAANPTVTHWLPRAEIQIERGMAGEVRITLPAWLAFEKGIAIAPSAGQGRLF